MDATCMKCSEVFKGRNPRKVSAKLAAHNRYHHPKEKKGNGHDEENGNGINLKDALLAKAQAHREAANLLEKTAECV